MDAKIDLINAELPKQCLNMVRNIYQDKHTNSYTKDVIVFEMRQIFTEHDVIGFLKDKSPL
ncbi:hypothetical protein ACDX78_13505 [Virgibacillus oceani]